MKPIRPPTTHERLQSLEDRAVATESNQNSLARSLVALMRRIFRRCQGKPVNHLSRQMTAEEAVKFHETMSAHGIPDDEESRGGKRHQKQGT